MNLKAELSSLSARTKLMPLRYRMLLQLFVLVVTLFPLPTLTIAVEQGQWRALIIGIGEYQDPRIPKLRTPVADGRDLAAVLTATFGFKVTTLFDGEATWANIDRELRRLITETGEQDSVLIYYGGHGDLDKKLGEGWWYPVDTVPGNRQTYLQNSDLRELIKKMAARHVLLMSDSCFAGALFGDYRSFSGKIDDRYHQRLYSGKSRLGFTSGGKEPVLDGGNEGHSIFAYHLLKFLQSEEKPVFSAGQMYTAIAPVVTNNSPQKPEFLPILYTGHESGEFIFVRRGTDIVAYVSTVEAEAKPVTAAAGQDRRLVWAGVGVVLAGLLFSLLLFPRLARRRREKNPILAEAAKPASPIKGLLLHGARHKIAIGPGPRQGLGRGERWVLAIADPHVSRKPHCWLQLNSDGLSVTGDGGEIKVNGEVRPMTRLESGDRLALGEVTEVLVEKAVGGMGALLRVAGGPEAGKRLALVGDGLPLQWLVGDHRGAGLLSWRDGQPWLTVAEGDTHPVPAKSGLKSFPLCASDILRLGEADLVVKVV